MASYDSMIRSEWWAAIGRRSEKDFGSVPRVPTVRRPSTLGYILDDEGLPLLDLALYDLKAKMIACRFGLYRCETPGLRKHDLNGLRPKQGSRKISGLCRGKCTLSYFLGNCTG